MRSGERAKNVLVTGATGFIGSNLTKELLLRGYTVTCLVRKKSNLYLLPKEQVHLVFGDLRSHESIREAVRNVAMVFHVAGAIKASKKEEYFQINKMGTQNLLKAALEVNPNLDRFIYISSLAAVGPSRTGLKLTETVEPNPISWYGKSKLEGEKEVLHYAGIFPVTILRPSAVYGPGDRETLIIFRMAKRGFFLFPGHTERRFSLIHVKDLVEGIIMASEKETDSGQVYFLSRPEIYTWDDVGRQIAQSLGKPFRRISLPRWLAQAAGITGDLYSRITNRPTSINGQKVKELLEPSWLCDSSKAENHLGFRPKIDLKMGILTTLRWYHEQGWL